MNKAEESINELKRALEVWDRAAGGEAPVWRGLALALAYAPRKQVVDVLCDRRLPALVYDLIHHELELELLSVKKMLNRARSASASRPLGIRHKELAKQMKELAELNGVANG